MSRHRPPVAAPLLSFPPSSTAMLSTGHASPLATLTNELSPSSSRASPSQPSRPKAQRRARHPLVRVCLMSPLFFISGLYAFAAYAYLFSLVLDFLFIERHHTYKAVLYGLVFIWLDSFACISVWQCYLIGGGNIGHGSGYDRAREPAVEDEESIIATFAPLKRVGAINEEEEEGLLAGEEANPRGIKTTAMRELSDLARTSGNTSMNGHGGVMVKSDGTARWCRKCRIPKPDRAHHCSSCGTCVLKMDHHCPWLGGGCVGHANYKFFVLFLLYSGLLGLWVATTTMIELVNFVSSDPNNFELAPIIWGLIFFIGCIFGIPVLLFGLYHLWLTFLNRTTIESMERSPSILPASQRSSEYRAEDHTLSREERRRLEKAQSKLNIYDLGREENFKQVFGQSWKVWFLPWGPAYGDGYVFPVNRDTLTRLKEITNQIRSGDESANGGGGGPSGMMRMREDDFDDDAHHQSPVSDNRPRY